MLIGPHKRYDGNDAEATILGKNNVEVASGDEENVTLFSIACEEKKILHLGICLSNGCVIVVAYKKLKESFWLNFLHPLAFFATDVRRVTTE